MPDPVEMKLIAAVVLVLSDGDLYDIKITLTL